MRGKSIGDCDAFDVRGKKRENKSVRLTSKAAISILLAFCLSSLVQVSGESEAGDDKDAESPSSVYRYTETIVVESEAPVFHEIGVTELPAFVARIDLRDESTPRFITLPELLQKTVGINIKDFGGSGQLSTVSIRGSDADQAVVLLDGIRLNSSKGGGVNLSSIPLHMLERVEILRGGDSAVFGNGAMGGVVNLVTRRSGGKFRFDIESSYGSFDTWGLGLHTAGKLKDIRYSLLYHYDSSQGDFTFTNDNGTEYNDQDDFEDIRRNNGFHSRGLLLKLSRDISPGRTVEGLFEGYIADRNIPGMTTFPSDHAVQEESRVSGRLRSMLQNFPAEGFSGDFQAYYRSDRFRFDDPYGEQTGVPVKTRQKTHLAGFQYGIKRIFRSVNLGGHFIYENERLDDKTYQADDRRIAAFRLKSDFPLFSDKLFVTTLLRYDDISSVGSAWSPKLGIRFKTGKNQWIKANIGQSFRAPGFNELYMNAGFMTGNPDLKPERGLSADFGIEYNSEKIRLTSAWFYNRTTDLIRYVIVSGFRYKPLNIGKARSEGIELECSVKPWNIVSFSTGYTLLKSMSLMDDPNTYGKQVPGKPRHNFFTRIDNDRGPFRSFIEYRYLSGNFITLDNTKELDERNIVNIGAGMRMPWFGESSPLRGLELGFEVKNMGDDEVADVRGFPLPGRAYYITVKYQYSAE